MSNKQGHLLSPLLFTIVLETLAITIKKEKEIKGVRTGKKKVKLSLFEDMILYVENPRDHKETKNKNPARINEFSKVAGYKVNTEKSVAFLYMNNEQ